MDFLDLRTLKARPNFIHVKKLNKSLIGFLY